MPLPWFGRLRLPAKLQRTVLFLAGTAIFATAYGQAPLYYSNQNQYFLHGLAQAGEGQLADDWLASTLDPTPVFSLLVAVTARFLPPWLFHVYYALLMGACAAALLGLFVHLVDPHTAARRWPIFVALLVAVHAAGVRWLCYRLLGQDYPWYFQAGVAGQYVLGAMFQPSTFGVLLIVGVSLFVCDRPVLAALALAIGATVHSTYLLPAALLTLGFSAALVIEKRFREAVGIAVLTLLLVLPVTIHVLTTFGPTTAETFAEAQDILVNLRIPHHARPDLWFDPVAALQIAWIGLGVVLSRGSRLFFLLVVPFALMLALTLLQVATSSNTLALLFPWRISSILVPIATAVVLSRLVQASAFGLRDEFAHSLAAVVVAASLVAGSFMSAGLAFRSSEKEVPLMDFVRNTNRPGDVYLLPVLVPDLAHTTHGSSSSDFKPLAEKRQDNRLIPIDLQRFRLYTGAAIYVDFKAIPYKDVEVIEWRRRLALAERVQKLVKEYRPSQALGDLQGSRVTHLVLPQGPYLLLENLERVYADEYYQVYRVLAP